jgi:hypothetical protein
MGWSEAFDEQGNAYYTNDETGETSWEKPADFGGGGGGGGGKNSELKKARDEIAKLKKQVQKLETRMRKAETGGNDKIGQINELKRTAQEATSKFDLQAGTSTTATTSQFQQLSKFERNARRHIDALEATSQALYVRMEQVLANKETIDVATGKFQRVNTIVANQRVRIVELTEELIRVKKELEETKETLRITIERQQEEIERVARPLRSEIVTQMELVAKEKRERKEDREWFAMLWPEGTEMPSILQMYYIPNAHERAAQRRKAERLDLGRAKGEAIRGAIIARNKWEESEDDFGRVIYTNLETEEIVWDRPLEHEFETPDGWDEEAEDGQGWFKPGWDAARGKWSKDVKGSERAEGEEIVKGPDIPTTVEEWSEGGAVYAALGADGQEAQYHPVNVGKIVVRDPSKEATKIRKDRKHKQKEEEAAAAAAAGGKQLTAAEIGRKDFSADADADDFEPVPTLDAFWKEGEEEGQQSGGGTEGGQETSLALVQAGHHQQQLAAAAASSSQMSLALALQPIPPAGAIDDAEKEALLQAREQAMDEVRQDALGLREAMEEKLHLSDTLSAKLKLTTEAVDRMAADLIDAEAAARALEEAEIARIEAEELEEACLEAEDESRAAWAAVEERRGEAAAAEEVRLEGEFAAQIAAETARAEAAEAARVAAEEVLLAAPPNPSPEAPQPPTPAEREQARKVAAREDAAAMLVMKNRIEAEREVFVAMRDAEAAASEQSAVAAAAAARAQTTAETYASRAARDAVQSRVLEPLSRVNEVRDRVLACRDAEAVHALELRPLLEQGDLLQAQAWERGSDIKRELLSELQAAMDRISTAEEEAAALELKQREGSEHGQSVSPETLPEPMPPVEPPLQPLQELLDEQAPLPPSPNRTASGTEQFGAAGSGMLSAEEYAAAKAKAEEARAVLQAERETEIAARKSRYDAYVKAHREWLMLEAARRSAEAQVVSNVELLTAQHAAAKRTEEGARADAVFWREELCAASEREERMLEKQGAAEAERARQMVESARAVEAERAMRLERGELEARVKAARELASKQGTNRFEREKLEQEASVVAEEAEKGVAEIAERQALEGERRAGKRADEMASAERRLLRLQQDANEHEERMAALALARRQRVATEAAAAALAAAQEAEAAAAVRVATGFGTDEPSKAMSIAVLAEADVEDFAGDPAAVDGEEAERAEGGERAERGEGKGGAPRMTEAGRRASMGLGIVTAGMVHMARHKAEREAAEMRMRAAAALLEAEAARFDEFKRLRGLANAREKQQLEAQELVQVPRGMWLLGSEEIRYEEALSDGVRRAARERGSMEDSMARVQKRAELLAEANSRLQRDIVASNLSRKREVSLVQRGAFEALEQIKATLARQRAKEARVNKEYEEERRSITERGRRELAAVEKRLRMWTVRAHRRGQWIETLRTELMGARRRSVELEETNFELRKVKADQVLTLRRELRIERERETRLQLWVEAMKTEIREWEALLGARDDALEKQKEAFAKQARRLKWETWRHASAAQRVLTDADALFLFFSQGVATLAGSGGEANAALRRNGAVHAMVALCNGADASHSGAAALRRQAARALGMLGWDGFVEPRMVGWGARRTWASWVESTYELEQRRMAQAGALPFDEAPPPGAAEYNAAAEQPKALIPGRRRWAVRMTQRHEKPNDENLALLGSAPIGALRALTLLCREPDLEVQAHAANAIAIASMHDGNNAAMGRMEGLVSVLVRLCRDTEDAEVQKHAAAALANVGYKESANQELIGRLGGVVALVEICRRTRCVDVLETASAALANLICRNDGNALRLGRADGIELLLDLTHTALAADIADVSLIEDVQANAAEALANLTRLESTETAERLRRRGMGPVVRMCASTNAMVRVFAPLVVGNVAQNDRNRLALGCSGAIEALFLLAESPDQDIQRNAMWALSNLAWAPDNQERIGCFLGQLVRLCRSKWVPVQANALVALANSLFFHDGNRRRLGHMPGALQRLMALVRAAPGAKAQEHALRAIAACAHNDACSLLLGEAGLAALLVELVEKAQPAGSPRPETEGDEAMVTVGGDAAQVGATLPPALARQVVTAFVNLSVHDDNKRRILDAGGVEALVRLHGDPDKEVRDTAATALEILADVPADEDLAKKKQVSLSLPLYLLRYCLAASAACPRD